MPAQIGVPDRAQHRGAEGHHRSQQQDHPLGAEHVDQDEAGQERAEDAADHAPGVHLRRSRCRSA